VRLDWVMTSSRPSDVRRPPPRIEDRRTNETVTGPQVLISVTIGRQPGALARRFPSSSSPADKSCSRVGRKRLR
jgi:hypothetical protein